ncbi:UbiX family flavin prenyltransferase [Planctomicrobium sp. SH664]|uniref:UbiX family flavin prenyltransferase n=1 Tax=Planctomicrobium sp. SH664 TaxID=3448125 RepID=UPI003F5B2259
MPTDPRRMIVGISGATGTSYGARLLALLRKLDVETQPVVRASGNLTRFLEAKLSASELKSRAAVAYSTKDAGAAIASRSFRSMRMIVAPCSIRTLNEIATDVTGSLLTRAADVYLKQRRRRVLMVGVTSRHAGQLKNMHAATEPGGIIAPPVPAFSTCPKNLEGVIDQTLAPLLDLYELEILSTSQWEQTVGPQKGLWPASRPFRRDPSRRAERRLVAPEETLLISNADHKSRLPFPVPAQPAFRVMKSSFPRGENVAAKSNILPLSV